MAISKPVATAKATAKTALNATSKVTPKAAAKVSPKAAPKAAAKPTTKITPATTKVAKTSTVTKAPAAVKTTAASKPVSKDVASKPRKAAPKRTVSAEQRNNYVEIAAFYIAERRGFAPGDLVADWLAAEAEIDQLIASGALGQS